ncbi:hypothetical protein IQ264_11455 [Phormidium sp. LEGE 05292]|uniref:hypothetical protein n=1 Tax=[Phormidium] sp. LEGE 05292 TaxID=767427 RepID=UPI00188210AE|nr:hypothetical protein [Phormidium sp. LEGE 05292]MBE9226040.1 hypothetical protein [Phormidium sp. LEGE 05292]
MNRKILILLLTVVMPGVVASGISLYYLFPEWAVLDSSYKNYAKIARLKTTTINELSIAQAAENRHRINCFAEGVGVLLGGIIAAIGIHGICIQNPRN